MVRVQRPVAREVEVRLPAISGTLCLRVALLASLTAVVLGGAAACSTAPQSSRDTATLTVAAAADLQSAFGEIGRQFETDTGSKVVFSFGSSGALAQQIENGAPIDLFASADEEYVRTLITKGYATSGTDRTYAIGHIALVVPKRSGAGAPRLADLSAASVRRVAIANPEHAPYGGAAKQAIVAAGLWAAVSPKLVYGENVRQALEFVQTGNADAGIVALSIADVPEVAYSVIDDALYRPLRQTVVVVKGTRHETLARQFVSFLDAPAARGVILKYGFSLPEER